MIMKHDKYGRPAIRWVAGAGLTCHRCGEVKPRLAAAQAMCVRCSAELFWLDPKGLRGLTDELVTTLRVLLTEDPLEEDGCTYEGLPPETANGWCAAITEELYETQAWLYREGVCQAAARADVVTTETGVTDAKASRVPTSGCYRWRS
jgi:hypothetical protein